MDFPLFIPNCEAVSPMQLGSVCRLCPLDAVLSKSVQKGAVQEWAGCLHWLGCDIERLFKKDRSLKEGPAPQNYRVHLIMAFFNHKF